MSTKIKRATIPLCPYCGNRVEGAPMTSGFYCKGCKEYIDNPLFGYEDKTAEVVAEMREVARQLNGGGNSINAMADMTSQLLTRLADKLEGK